MIIRPLAVPDGEDVLDLLPRIAAALAGDGPIAPYAAGSPIADISGAEATGASPDLPTDLAVVIATSGSTGVAKRAMLSARALTASADATHARLGGPGTWVLALPAHHIGGMQVLLRSVRAGTSPVVVDRRDGFAAGRFVDAVRLADIRPLYTALVPTQVGRLLEDDAAREALTRLDAVLVGGAATTQRLRTRATDAGIRLVTSYGMSETAGGCVYDGLPLEGTTVRLTTDGRVTLGGPTIAHGYLGRPDLTAEAFAEDPDGTRWFATDDLAELDPDGRLRVLGRIDDVIVTGGMKVLPRVVEEAVLDACPDVRRAVVVGVEDAEWGEIIAVTLVPSPGARPLTVPELRERLRSHLPAFALPRRVATLPEIPEIGPGKADRRRLRRGFPPEV